MTRKLTAGKSEPVPVIAVFERKADRYLAVVRVGIEELKDPGLEVTKGVVARWKRTSSAVRSPHRNSASRR